MIDDPDTQYRKMDILYFNSINRLKYYYKKAIVVQIFTIIFLIILLIIDIKYLKRQQTQIIIFILFNIGAVFMFLSGYIVLTNLYFKNNKKCNIAFLAIAQQSGHLTQQGITNPLYVNDINLCVSQFIYNQAHGLYINNPQLTESVRDKYQRINAQLIQAQIMNKKIPFVYFSYNVFLVIFCIGLFIWWVILIVKAHPTALQIIAISICLIPYLGFGFLIALVIIFSPILCVGLCIYVCIRRQDTFIDRTSIIIPEAIQATSDIIEKSQGSCIVCLQSFMLKQKIIHLQCSQKHIFHQNCILNWLKIANSCPICRTPLTSSI